MNIRVACRTLSGALPAISSKSYAHRLLIASVLADKPTLVRANLCSKDIEATVRCLRALGAQIRREEALWQVHPIRNPACNPVLPCGESGSTYRFLLPVACSLVDRAWFGLEGKLPQRPMEPLLRPLRLHGLRFSGEGTDCVTALGRLHSGRFELPGNVSSQFISAMLLALPRLEGDSEIVLTQPLESTGYVLITLEVLSLFQIRVLPTSQGYCVPGGQRFCSPEDVTAEGDWSNAAFFLCAAAASGRAEISGLNKDSCQGDARVLSILEQMGAKVLWENGNAIVEARSLRGIAIDASEIPDLVPALAVAACAAQGETRFTHAERLRLKESDRIHTIVQAVRDLGGSAQETQDGLAIQGGTPLTGGTADAANDHRVAMLAACLAPQCGQDVCISGAEAVQKSYPSFFDDLARMGATVERGT